MKNLSKTAQTIIEYIILLLLLSIIIVGIYKLANKWIEKKHPQKCAKIQKIIDAPSKELCTFMMKQCQSRYPTQP